MKKKLLLSVFLVLSLGRGICQSSQISLKFIGIQDITLEELSVGALGKGYLLYSTPSLSDNEAKFIVAIENSFEGTRAMVYQPTQGKTTLSFVLKNNELIIRNQIPPSITMVFPDGWWIRDGKVNYNFDVFINGPMYAMWGSAYDISKGGFGKWAAIVEPYEPTVKISVRDPEYTGIPLWDMRQLLPEFPLQGFIRFNYTERKCSTVLEHGLGISPQWPFIRITGHYEQPVGSIFPPIVVDWDRSLITHFSELVTARNQSCSYTHYSLIKPNFNSLDTQTLNFETPFAFYDFSGRGNGHPNLIIRTGYFPQGDPIITYPLLNQNDLSTIRYSWRDGVGDRFCDYKIEVVGFHNYNAATPIAGEQLIINAPEYEDFPSWVLSQEWPITVFIDTEAVSYACTEGIYEWPPMHVLGGAFVYGWTNKLSGLTFSPAANLRKGISLLSLRKGTRGEFYFGKDKSPILYYSPVDNRLHLLGAIGGNWQLSNSIFLEVENILKDDYIDTWRLIELQQIDGQEIDFVEAITDVELQYKEKLLEELVVLGDYALHWRDNQLTIHKVNIPLYNFEILPPHSNKSWLHFRETLGPLESIRRNPQEMSSWLNDYVENSLILEDVYLKGTQTAKKGVLFRLEAGEQVFSDGGLDFPSLQDLSQGELFLFYDGKAWKKIVNGPTSLIVDLQSQSVNALEPVELVLEILNENYGDFYLWDKLSLLVNGELVDEWQGIFLESQEVTTLSTDWLPHTKGEVILSVEHADKIISQKKIVVQSPQLLLLEGFYQSFPHKMSFYFLIIFIVAILILVSWIHSKVSLIWNNNA